ncbi:MAG: phenylalanine--tRNA ligase subunit alpha [Planctomycetes bacterium]|nr:phenylalanine--tRNA ligase subunit alpha [Planctomycetota bacterium]
MEPWETIKTEATKAIGAAESLDALEAVRVEYLGRKGKLRAAMDTIKDVPKEDRAQFGKEANEVKDSLTLAFDEKKNALEADAPPVEEYFDDTIPGIKPRLGTEHPVLKTLRDISSIFERLGFTILRGPEVEDAWHAFDALNIPESHPARNPEDNFVLENDMYLRSQTSTIQIRAMQKMQPPIRVLGPGRVYRPDTVDASHYFQFHQIEGLVVDTNITFKDLKSVLNLFVREYFGREIKTRFRPHYFPFTEPSAELDVACLVCSGGGCPACSGKGFQEMLGCGMVDPIVFEKVGYDPGMYTGFAFGLGVERLCMQKYEVRDIRLFVENDVRFLRQFQF